ncbi:MAG: Y-family DNA polymerase, partial [Victivallales bacterium]|nr:Y-family DNA polymerase [Victivallales bacterium]
MVGLVDCNNFFVSCERIFEPALEGRPVAVLSNNDGVVVARSKELKALGVPMGEPYFRLKELAPLYGIAFRSSNYELYGDISRRVMEVLSEDSPMLEQYSIDEAFIHISLKLSEEQEPSAAYTEYATHLRKKLLKWIGMPVGVGFAQTKTLAKIANHTAKKLDSGVFVMPRPDHDLLREIPVGDVWGVGRRIADRLASIGIRNARALAEMDPHDVRRRFSVCLLRTVYELNGIKAIDYGEFDSPTKTATCSRAFGMPVTEFSDLRESIAEYTETAARRIREIGRKANGCSLYLQIYPEYHPVPLEGGFVSDNIPLKRPTSNTSEILAQIFP